MKLSTLGVRLALSGAGVLLALGIAELAFRFAPGALGLDLEQARGIQHLIAHGSPIYQPHPYTGYYGGGGPASEVASMGRNHPRAGRPGVARVACLGGSTTAWGYPADLRRQLREALGREVEVTNWGVGNWTSAESVVNWLLNGQDGTPDAVVVHHAVNDAKARLQAGYRTDYSHFRRPYRPPATDPWLRPLAERSLLVCALLGKRSGLRGVHDMVGVGQVWDSERAQDPERAAGFLRNMRTLVRHAQARGALAIVMTQPQDEQRAQGRHADHLIALVEEHNELVRELAREEGALLVDLDAQARALGEARRQLFVDHVHMTPDGRKLKAAAVAQALLQSGVLEP